jgi:hypothetical protein
VTGRVFFEEAIRENLDIARPSQVSLVFHRKVGHRTPGRTRVISDGVVRSLRVDYRKSRIKQYHKEGQALRIEIKSRTPVTSPSVSAGSGSRPSPLKRSYSAHTRRPLLATGLNVIKAAWGTSPRGLLRQADN